MTARTRALVLLAYATGVTVLLVLAGKCAQWRTAERDRTCRMALAALTAPSDSLFRASAPWCR